MKNIKLFEEFFDKEMISNHLQESYINDQPGFYQKVSTHKGMIVDVDPLIINKIKSRYDVSIYNIKQYSDGKDINSKLVNTIKVVKYNKELQTDYPSMSTGDDNININISQYRDEWFQVTYFYKKDNIKSGNPNIDRGYRGTYSCDQEEGLFKLLDNILNEEISERVFESAISSLLDISNNVDEHLMNTIKDIVTPGSSILEISCGNGADSYFLQKEGYNVSCTEFDDTYVENAVKIGLNCIKHDTKKPFPFNKKFDLVYSRLGLHYFTKDELRNIFSEIKRIGNKILITVKVEADNIKTNKIILTPIEWRNIVSEFFDIDKLEIKEGILYGQKSKWVEIIAK